MPRVSQSTIRPAGTLQRDSLHPTPIRVPSVRQATYQPLYPSLPAVLPVTSEFWDVDVPEDDNTIEPRSLFKSTPQSRLPPITEYWDDDDVVQYIAADPVETIQSADVQNALYYYGEIETPALPKPKTQPTQHNGFQRQLTVRCRS